MEIERVASLSQYILKLYNRTSNTDPAQFAASSLDGLCSVLRADKAWWGIMDCPAHEPRLSSSYTIGLSGHWETAWETVRHHDTLMPSVSSNRGRTFLLESDMLPPNNSLTSLAEGFDIAHTASISVDLPSQLRFMFYSVFRGHSRNRFTTEDALLNQLLAPHLQAAWTDNLLAALRSHPSYVSSSTCRAFVDRDGRLVQSDDSFAKFVNRTWSSWRGGHLPLTLAEAVRAARKSPGEWFGRKGWRMRALPAGLLTLLELRLVSALDTLSPRERQVANLYADGATHKEIAKVAGLTPATTRHYLREAYAKLGVSNKAELVRLVVRESPMHA